MTFIFSISGSRIEGGSLLESGGGGGGHIGTFIRSRGLISEEGLLERGFNREGRRGAYLKS